LTAALIDPNGVEVKSVEIPSKSDGTFKVDQLKIPTNAISGTWKINVSSGANLDKTEFQVISLQDEGIIIEIGEIIQIPGFGDSIKIGITTVQKTSVTLQVLDKNANFIGESISCSPTADFKCEILWTIPKDMVPGTYTISVNDSKTTVTKELVIE